VRLLSLDLETSPHLVWDWDLHNLMVSIDKIVATTEMMCFSAKWWDEKDVLFYSIPKNGKDQMVREAHRLLDEADVVMHYNGKRFDIPHLNREFLELGLLPPSPYQQIDLYQAVRKQFRLASTKLQYVSKMLGLEGKVQHSGFSLWVKCMAGDPAAWREMESYNRQDVILLEQLYAILQPWIPHHPARTLIDGTAGDACPACGSSSLEKRGFAIAIQRKYQRYVCRKCGKWSRGGKSLGSVEIREVA
jgi:predicted RNA-binding Zn-ribbon protein involved in translation (DUF1610 family)